MAGVERDLQSIKEEVRSRIDIVEVIGQYTQLKRSGKSWTGLCPFHADRKPSFNVSPQIQWYQCWSCGEKGDIFTFIMKKENLDFMEALELLAKRAGVNFERTGESRERLSEKEEALELNRLAVKYFQDRLTKSQEAKDYLAGRAILKQTQDQWDLGFAPPEWEGLTFYLQKNRADLMLATKIGLIKSRSENGSRYDTFRNRLIFPIHDLQGRVVAFGGRAMSADDPAKYLNSEASLIFDKSRTLYGLLFARKKITPAIPPVFVEGYVDVIATHQAGFTQCVATLGTSMTEEHARTLVRYSPKAVICYDGDSAGIKATLRGAGVWEAMGVEGTEIRVARLPAGEDPDSLLRKGETAAFQLALDNAIPRVEFQIEMTLQRHDTNSEDGRSAALSEIIPILASIRSLTQRDLYLQKVSVLHPGHRYNSNAGLVADIEAYQRQQKNKPAPRDQAYPLTESLNGKKLAQNPPPPSYQRSVDDGMPSRQQNYKPKSAFKRDVWVEVDGKWKKLKPEEQGYMDTTPPSLSIPTLSGVEKAERQLLRGLFSVDWRTYILSRIQPEEMATLLGSRLLALASRTPAREDGSIDPIRLLRLAEDEETTGAKEEEEDPYAEENPDAEEDPYAKEEAMGTAIALKEDFSGRNPLNPSLIVKESPKIDETRRIPAKLTEFTRDVLEESVSLVSKEPLNEAVIGDCIRRLQNHRNDLARRELQTILLREDLSIQQKADFAEKFHEQMRRARGSQQTENSG